jgi:hypothetical protein
MKNRINESSSSCLVLAVLCLLCVSHVAAQTTTPIIPTQTEQIYVISSQAGGVSEIEGDVRVKRARAMAMSAAQVLAKGDTIRDGDRIITGTDGRAEILLNPGSYLRIGENAEVELTSTSLDALKIRLVQGSAIVEANSIGGEKGAGISIDAAQIAVQLEKAGLYRINASGVTTEIYVWEGLARVGGQVIKKGRRMTVGAGVGGEAIVSFNRGNLDALDKWSAARASELAKLNDRLERNALDSTLASNNWNNNSYFSEGYWVFDRRTRAWCYIPYYGARERCCRAYRQNHNNAIRVKKEDSTASVVYNPRKTDETAVEVLTKGSTGETSGGSSGKSDYDSPPTKSDSYSAPSKSDTYSPPPAKNDSPPPPPPSKSDDLPPPSKKDGFK